MVAGDQMDPYPEGNRTCAATVDVESLRNGPREGGAEDGQSRPETDEEGQWHCPHPRLDGEDRCCFHAGVDESTAPLVSEAFLAALDRSAAADDRAAKRRYRQFLGADVRALVLDDEAVRGENNVPVDLRGATLGALSLRNAVVEVPVDIRGASVGALLAPNATLSRLYGTGVLAGRLVFDQATVERAYFGECHVFRARFLQASADYVDFPDAEVTWGNFVYAEFGEAGFIGTRFQLVSFFRTDFESAYLNGLRARAANFAFSRGWEIHLGDCDVDGAAFRRASFERAYFDDARFDRVDFDEVQFDWARFRRSHLGVTAFPEAELGRARFEEATFHRSLSFRGADLEHVDLDLSNVADGTGYLDLRGVSLPRGSIHRPRGDETVVDLEGATVGDVSLTGSPSAVLDSLRVLDTEFDGVDFEQQVDGEPVLALDENGHTLHTLPRADATDLAVGRTLQRTAADAFAVVEGEADALGATGLDNRIGFEEVLRTGLPADLAAEATAAAERAVADETVAPPDVGDGHSHELLEKTYLWAKNGAKAIGNSRASGRFFEKERKHRRRAHWDTAAEWLPLSDPWLVAASRWGRSALMAATCGYGERPSRVVLSSFFVVTVAAVFFLLAGEGPITLLRAGESVLFSFQSFVTFLVGEPPAARTLAVRVGSSVEGFLGAFLIALFVFTLTRQVHR